MWLGKKMADRLGSASLCMTMPLWTPSWRRGCARHDPGREEDDLLAHSNHALRPRSLLASLLIIHLRKASPVVSADDPLPVLVALMNRSSLRSSIRSVWWSCACAAAPHLLVLLEVTQMCSMCVHIEGTSSY